MVVPDGKSRLSRENAGSSLFVFFFFGVWSGWDVETLMAAKQVNMQWPLPERAIGGLPQLRRENRCSKRLREAQQKRCEQHPAATVHCQYVVSSMV